MRKVERDFYRQVGMRTFGQLTKPRLIPIEQLALPFESILHYAPDASDAYGPSVSDPFFNGLDRVYVEHITRLSQQKGRVLKAVFNEAVAQREYRKHNRAFKPLSRDEIVSTNRKTVLVVNYAMLHHSVRYTDTPRTHYDRWSNYMATICTHIENVADRFNRNQYLELQIPDDVPTRADFQRLSSGPSPSVLKKFETNASLVLFDLWMWLGDEEMRQASHLGKIPESKIDKLNFIVRVKDRFFVMNMKFLNDLRKTDDNEGSQEPGVLQKYYVSLLHALRDLIAGDTELEAIEDTEGNEIDKVSLGIVSILPDPVTDEGVEEVLPPSFDMSELPSVKDEIDHVEQPLTSRTARAKAQALEPTESEAIPLEGRIVESITQDAWDLHVAGSLSAGAYKRTVEEAAKVKDIKNPWTGKGSITGLFEITDEDMSFDEADKFPDSDTIPDKSMLSSTTNAFHNKYVKSIMRKDIARSVMSLSNQGVVIRDYQVEVVRDAMNHMEIHTVVAKPICGPQSTLRFQVPVVDEYGRFISNGSDYRMRLQRAD